MKKTWGVIILIIWFLWTLSRDVLSLFSWADSVDFAVYSGNGLGPVFFVVAIVAVALEAFAAYFLFKPSRVGFWVCLAAVLWSVLQNAIASLLVVSNLDLAKQAYIASRVSRGLSVRPEFYDVMFTLPGVLVVFLFVLTLNAVVAFLVIWNRRYFAAAHSTR